METELQKNSFCSAGAAIKTLHFVDVKNVTSATPTASGWNVVLNSGHYWRRIHFSEAEQSTKAVDMSSVETSITAKIPGVGGIAERDLIKLRKSKYLVKIADYNGETWLVGTPSEPLTFDVAENKNGELAGDTAYTVSFTGILQWPSMKMV